jgi:hypothetical protein
MLLIFRPADIISQQSAEYTAYIGSHFAAFRYSVNPAFIAPHNATILATVNLADYPADCYTHGTAVNGTIRPPYLSTIYATK